MTDTERTTFRRPDARLDQGDPPDMAHIVRRDDQMRGYVAGESIVALCGKKFVPSKDYEGLPVCQACREARDRILAGRKRLN